MTYHYLDGDGHPEGPLSLEELRTLFAEGLLNRKSKVSREGGEWKEARLYSELSGAVKPRFDQVHSVYTAKKETSKNPPSFALFVVLALLLWPVGLIGAIAYLCEERNRSAGFALLGISICSALLSWAFLFH